MLHTRWQYEVYAAYVVAVGSNAVCTVAVGSGLCVHGDRKNTLYSL